MGSNMGGFKTAIGLLFMAAIGTGVSSCAPARPFKPPAAERPGSSEPLGVGGSASRSHRDEAPWTPEEKAEFEAAVRAADLAESFEEQADNFRRALATHHRDAAWVMAAYRFAGALSREADSHRNTDDHGNWLDTGSKALHDEQMALCREIAALDFKAFYDSCDYGSRWDALIVVIEIPSVIANASHGLSNEARIKHHQETLDRIAWLYAQRREDLRSAPKPASLSELYPKDRPVFTVDMRSPQEHYEHDVEQWGMDRLRAARGEVFHPEGRIALLIDQNVEIIQRSASSEQDIEPIGVSTT